MLPSPPTFPVSDSSQDIELLVHSTIEKQSTDNGATYNQSCTCKVEKYSQTLKSSSNVVSKAETAQSRFCCEKKLQKPRLLFFNRWNKTTHRHLNNDYAKTQSTLPDMTKLVSATTTNSWIKASCKLKPMSFSQKPLRPLSLFWQNSDAM